MSNSIWLNVDDVLRDKENVYTVLDMKWENSHSQYPSHYFLKCLGGPNKDREFWAGNVDLSDYITGGKYWNMA